MGYWIFLLPAIVFHGVVRCVAHLYRRRRSIRAKLYSPRFGGMLLFSFQLAKVTYMVKVILAIIATAAGVFLALGNSIEEPITVGKSNVLFWVSFLNLLWFIPYVTRYDVTKNRKKLKHCIVLFGVIFASVLFFKFYRTSFNSEKWKTQFDYIGIKDSIPPVHSNGNMVESIVESEMLVGLARSEILRILGDGYYITWRDSNETLSYRYSYNCIFDGCNRLDVMLKNDTCVRAYYGGCD